jgi:S-adenosylmethionine:tRNA ribosyltransferase-isomerase
MTTGGLRTADYDFDLPPDLIAQHPLPMRDDSRLMVIDRRTGSIEHAHFRDLQRLVPAKDALVLNDSRVINARLKGTRSNGGEAEVMLLEPRGDGAWEALVRPGAKLKPGRRVRIAADAAVVIGEALRDGTRIVQFDSVHSIDTILERYGHIPLPPYIERPDTADDAERYQTIYAATPGSVAAPTAGLHFTPQLLAGLEQRGVRRVHVTLHVGAGTFKPVEHADPGAHVLHTERFTFGPDAARELNETRRAGSAIWAVGTTSLRVLESVVDGHGHFVPGDGATDIFIRPPHVVRSADHLVTNFHLPRSTLLMLVAAFAGFDLTRHAYSVAISEGYRFYSYGDAMCIL